MAGPLLNDDVLLHTMSFLNAIVDRRTICALMQTSRLFHHAGAQYLLADGACLDTSEQVHSFVAFMLADGNFRLHLLRTLELNAQTLPLHTGYGLAVLFHQLAEHGILTSLKIQDADNLLSSHPALPYTIAKLPTLKSLCMYNTGIRGRLLLRHLRSALVYANLQLPPDDDTDDDDDDDYDESASEDTEETPAREVSIRTEHPDPDIDEEDLIALLRQSRESLRELHLSSLTSFVHSGPELGVFPNVTSVTLYLRYPDSCTGCLAHMFPNLQELETRDFNPDGRPFDIVVYDFHRTRNQEDQEERGAWRSLRYYEGTLEVFYSLGIVGHIPWLKLRTEDNEFEPELLADLLHEARPTHLFFVFWGAGWFLEEEFLEIFQEAGTRRLETLHLMVFADEGDEELDGLQILDTIASRIVAPLRFLKEFKFTLECGFMHGELDAEPLSNLIAATALELVLQQVDMQKYAERLVRTSAAASGSLGSVSVRLPCRSKSLTRGEVGPQIRDFHVAYGDELNTIHEWDEEDEKAWSGVRRFA